MQYICSLDKDIPCVNRLTDNIHCNNNPACGFCSKEAEVETKTSPNGYVRKERWYEKYYR